LRIALYSSIAYERDAISRSFLLKLGLFRRLQRAGYPIEVTGFAQDSDFEDPDIRVIPTITGLIRDERFNAADLHIFEYGMPYDLFNALFLIDRPSLVIDHNTSPPDVVADPYAKWVCARARLERNNLSVATHIAAVSEFTRDELLGMGMEGDRLSVLHLPPTNAFTGRAPHESHAPVSGEVVHLAYVGRLVRAKGIMELLAAVTSRWDRGDVDLHLTIAGGLRFSEEDIVAGLEEAAQAYGGDGRLTLLLDGSDDDIAALYGRSEVVVIPSHHEGYCVPVIEAMASGCYVIGSDAGNIPTIMGDLGSVVPTGDVRALTETIARCAACVRRGRTGGGPLVWPTSGGGMELEEWQQRVAHHLESYTEAHFETTLLGIVNGTLESSPMGSPAWLQDLCASGPLVGVGSR
jgi:glycosyltransferase involved in cell wall biosynthesis